MDEFLDMYYNWFMDIKKLAEWTMKINNQFKKEFSDQGRALSLVSEVGELADAMLEYDGSKEKGTRESKGLEEIADALSDIQYNLFVLASHYKIDLGEDYEKMLTGLSKRFKSGEFVVGETSDGDRVDLAWGDDRISLCGFCLLWFLFSCKDL